MKKGVKQQILLLHRFEMMGAHVVEPNVSKNTALRSLTTLECTFEHLRWTGLLLASQLELAGNRKPLLRPANETMCPSHPD